MTDFIAKTRFDEPVDGCGTLPLLGNTDMRLRHSILAASTALALVAAPAGAQEVFIVDTETMVTNGDAANNVMDSDTLIVTESGSIDVSGNNVPAMQGTGNFIELNNRGRLATDGEEASAQIITGDFGTIFNSGTITTMDGESSGQAIIGNSGVIINSGAIITTGDELSGQVISVPFLLGIDASAQITNSGTVMTEVLGATGQVIFIQPVGNTSAVTNTASTTNSGKITTTGEPISPPVFGSHGQFIFLRANGNSGAITNIVTVTNTDTITTLGSYAHGQFTFINVDDNSGAIANTNTITNSGTIVTGSRYAHGQHILVEAGSNTGTIDNVLTIFNTGAITTSGDDSDGQNINGDFGTIFNTGTITTRGDTAIGQFIDGDNGMVTNAGIITTAGHVAHGQQRRGDDTTLTNTGTIITTGLFAYGQDGRFGSGDVINIGTITTRGNFSTGQSGSDGHLINTGNITTWGPNANGQFLGGRDATLTNSGRVVSVQADAISFDDRRDGNTLNLLAPGFIGGLINYDFSAGTPTMINVTTGPSHSILWSLAGDMVGGAPDFSGSVPWFYNATTQTVATFDPTLLASETAALGDLTSLLSQLGLGALGGFGPDMATGSTSPLAYMSSGQAPGSAADAVDRAAQAETVTHRVGRAWATAFGGQMDHDGNDTTLDADIDHWGVAAGYTWQQSRNMSISTMVGYAHGDQSANSRWSPSFDHDTHTAFAGLHAKQQYGSGVFGFGLIAGYQQVDHNRLVNDNLAPLGESWVTADYGGVIISPEIAISTDIEMANGITVKPNAGLRYAAQWLDGYTETGAVNTAANATVGARYVGMLEARAELEARRVYDFGHLAARIGYLGRWNGGDDAAAITLNGVSQDVGSGYQALNAAYVGATVRGDVGKSGFVELDGSYLIGDTAQGFTGRLNVGRTY